MLAPILFLNLVSLLQWTRRWRSLMAVSTILPLMAGCTLGETNRAAKRVSNYEGWGMDLNGDVFSYALDVSAGLSTDNAFWIIRQSSTGKPGSFRTVAWEFLEAVDTAQVKSFKKACEESGRGIVKISHFGPSLIEISHEILTDQIISSTASDRDELKLFKSLDSKIIISATLKKQDIKQFECRLAAPPAL